MVSISHWLAGLLFMVTMKRNHECESVSSVIVHSYTATACLRLLLADATQQDLNLTASLMKSSGRKALPEKGAPASSHNHSQLP
jgi:hypothetical protein